MKMLIICFFVLIPISISFSQQSTSADTTSFNLNEDLKLLRSELNEIKLAEKSINWISIIVTSVTTLLAVFIGAFLAFHVQAKTKEKEKIAAGNRTIFYLMTMSNILANFNDQHLEKYKNDAAKFISMRGLYVPLKQDIDLDIDSISFLLETDFRNLLFDISIGLQKYQTTIGAINYRSNLHIKEIQPMLAKEGIEENRVLTRERIEKALGLAYLALIENSTDDIFKHTPKTITYIEDITNKLSNALKELFSESKIIKSKRTKKAM